MGYALTTAVQTFVYKKEKTVFTIGHRLVVKILARKNSRNLRELPLIIVTSVKTTRFTSRSPAFIKRPLLMESGLMKY